MAPIRYAAWAAVSTKQQAEKISIQGQVQRAHEVASAKGWEESAGPYIVPGKSRTRWVNLRDAEHNIPALRQMLDEARAGRFDVLVCYDYTRFRDLLEQIATSLKHYRVQLYSLNQPTEIRDPRNFDPYTDGGAEAMRAIHKVSSSSEIAAIRNRYRLGMPNRIKRGLPPSIIPFGYRKPPGQEWNPQAVPEIDPVSAPWVIKAKDMLLSGSSSNQIADYLNEHGAKPPRAEQFGASSVLRFLANPFYYGVVRFGHRKHFLDPRTGRKYSRINPDPITAPGKHEPLWDEATHRQILRELKDRRARNYHGGGGVNHFSCLLRCSVCDAVMTHDTNGSRAVRGRHIWRCRNYRRGNGHATIHGPEIEHRFCNELTREARAVPDPVQLSPHNGSSAYSQLEDAITDLLRRRERIEAAYEAGAYSLLKFQEKAAPLDEQLREYRSDLAELEASGHAHNEVVETLRTITDLLEHLPEWLVEEDPARVNQTLRVILEKVVVTPDKTIELVFN